MFGEKESRALKRNITFQRTDAPVSCPQGSRCDSSAPSEAGPPGGLSDLLCRPREAGREASKANTDGGDGQRQDVNKLRNLLPNLETNWPVTRPSSRS